MSVGTINKALDDALISKVNAGDFSPITINDVAWQNLQFTPTVDRPWLAQSSVIDRELTGAGSSGIVTYRGSYMISVIVPAGKGAAVYRPLVDAVIAAFSRKTLTTSGGSTIQLLDTSPQAGIPDGPWYRTPVRISLECLENT